MDVQTSGAIYRCDPLPQLAGVGPMENLNFAAAYIHQKNYSHLIHIREIKIHFSGFCINI